MGTMAQMNDTCRHDNMDPKPDTKHIPKLNEMLDNVIITPRTDGSLQMNARRLFNEKEKNSRLKSEFLIEFY